MLIIMDTNFKRLCEIKASKSIIWHELFLDVEGGDFTLELPTQPYIDFVAKEYYIINTESEKFGIIDTFDTKETDEGENILTVSGLMGESLLKRRVIFPTLSLSGELWDVVGTILRRNIIQPANANRKIANFVYDENQEYNARVSKQYTGKTVAEALVGMLSPYGMGFSVSFNETYDGFVFRLKNGLDHSTAQAENPWIVFSTGDYGVSEFVYKTSNAGTFSHVIAAGEGEGSGRKYVVYPATSTPSTAGIYRREVFHDCKDISSNAGGDAELSESAYMAKLFSAAAEKLAESSATEACEGVVKLSRYRYKTDFNLGDVVSVMDDKNERGYTTRVLGVLLTTDENGATETTAEMGNLAVIDSAEDPETDPSEDELAEETIDPTQVYLSEAIRPLTFEGGDFVQVDQSGAEAKARSLPSGWLHIHSNDYGEFVLTASTHYFSGTAASTLGNAIFTLTPEQHAVFGKLLENELAGLTYPVQVLSGGVISIGYITITLADVSSGQNEDGSTQYTYTCSTSLQISVPDGAFALLINGVRALIVPPPAPLTDVSYLENPDTIVDDRKGQYWLILKRSLKGQVVVESETDIVDGYDYWCYFFDEEPLLYWEQEDFFGTKMHLYATTNYTGCYKTAGDYPSAREHNFDYMRSSGVPVMTPVSGYDPPDELADYTVRAYTDPEGTVNINPWEIVAANFDVWPPRGSMYLAANAEDVGNRR